MVWPADNAQPGDATVQRLEGGVLTYYMTRLWDRLCRPRGIATGGPGRGFILDTVAGAEVWALSDETAMHSKHLKPEPNHPTTPDPDAAGMTGDLGSALVEFARRLANFGLGEAETPLLDEFVDRRRYPRLQP
jgi:hypothetical protein